MQKKKIFILVWILGFLSNTLYAQQNPNYIWQSKFSFATSLSEKWEAQSSLQLRQNINLSEDNVQWIKKTESKASITREFFNDSKASFGYIFAENYLFDANLDHEHRLQQQYAFYFHYLKYRIGNRLRTEQRFYPETYKNRFRYRVSIDFPLSGDNLNMKEPYFVAADEVLTNINSQEHDFENRLAVGMGWQLDKLYKIQIQLQHRVSELGRKTKEHALFVATSFYFRL